MMATIPTLQIPTQGAVSGGADFSPLAQLPQLYQKYQQEQANKQALAQFQQTGDPKALIGSGDMNLAQLGISAQTHMDTLKQQAIQNKMAEANLAINHGRYKHETKNWENTPDQFATNPDGSIRDLYAEAQARARAIAAQAPAEGFEVNPDYGKVAGAPSQRPISGGP